MKNNARLPIDSYLEEIGAAYLKRQALIIKAEPGAGKTTRVPPALMGLIEKPILVIEPRRLAARLSAERVAFELGEPLGERVGYQIRFDKNFSQKTKIKYITEGIFSRLAWDDPLIGDVGCVIIDEFHERHIHSDVALAITKHLMTNDRPDLKLIIMSATINTAKLERYLSDVQVFDIPGKTYPVAIEYIEPQKRQRTQILIDTAVRRMLNDKRCPANILVFLTGMQEIMRTVDVLRQTAREHDAIVLPLTAEIPFKEQKRVFDPSTKRKIILATNVAETSLTIPEITGVIDLGLAKISGFGSWSGISTLDIKKISQASCIQRTGRAGRTMAGVCYRLYAERDFLARPYALAPEICRIDLSQTILELLSIAQKANRTCCRLQNTFPFLDLPEAKTITTLMSLLHQLGALDTEGFLTQKGLKMSFLPIHPRLAAIILEGKEADRELLALLAASLINEGMIVSKGIPAIDVGSCDISYQIELYLKHLNDEKWDSESQRRLVDHRKARRVGMLMEQLYKRTGLPLKKYPAKTALTKMVRHSLSSYNLGNILLSGYPDRVAKLRSQKKKNKGPSKPLFNLCMGRGGFLDDSSVVRKEELIIVVDAVETHDRHNAALGTQISIASAITMDLLVASDSPLKREEQEIVWDPKDERVLCQITLYYGNLMIGNREIAKSKDLIPKVAETLCQAVKDHWDKVFEDPHSLDLYHNRIDLLAKNQIHDKFPSFQGELLELLIAFICDGKESFAHIRKRSLREYIEDQLSFEMKEKLNQLVPQLISLPRGRKVRIHYEKDRAPWIASRLQDFFGLNGNPAIADGRIGLVVHLLAPNLRPVQVTQDLASFWRKSYPKIRVELMRRYPKHAWPENPGAKIDG